ncbi:putative ribonuclease H-like domain-containing protein [Tanacetum coccineum]
MDRLLVQGDSSFLNPLPKAKIQLSKGDKVILGINGYVYFTHISPVGPSSEPSFVTFGGSFPIDVANLPYDPLIPELEDTAKIQSTGIFCNAYGIFLNLDLISQALDDESWVETMQEKLLQFKIQKVWTLVDLPSGKKAIGTKVEAIRLFLAFALFMNFLVFQMDVKSVFLYGTIEEEVYVCQPPGFVDPEFPEKVYKVEKALYGLHQAPRAWYETLSTYLLDNRFHRGQIDKTLFIKRLKDNAQHVSDEFNGRTYFLLGTPMETHKALTKDKDGVDVDVHLYKSVIGSLMYLTSSRPDIMFSVCACSRFQVQAKVSHLNAVKRIFRYLKGQPKLGL